MKARFRITPYVLAALFVATSVASAQESADTDWARRAADAGRKAADATNSDAIQKSGGTAGEKAKKGATAARDEARKAAIAEASVKEAQARQAAREAEAREAAAEEARTDAVAVQVATNADEKKAPAKTPVAATNADTKASTNVDTGRKPMTAINADAKKPAAAVNADSVEKAGVKKSPRKPGEKKKKKQRKGAAAKAAAEKKATVEKKPAPAKAPAKAVAPAKKPTTKTTAKKPAPPKVAPPGSVQLATLTTVAANVLGKDKILDECRIETSLPAAIAERNPNVFLIDKPAASGSVLSLKIVELRASGGGILSGPKGLTVDGRLIVGGKLKGTFIAKDESMGSVSSCGMLNKVVFELAGEIGAWLDQPGMNSRLGNAR